MQITKVTLEQLEQVIPLFSGYLTFYSKSHDIHMIRSFLKERITKNESTIFLAQDESLTAMGFTQVYRSFTSVGMAPILILNDLFVESEFRKMGVARALIDKVKGMAKDEGAVRFNLETGISNHKAQRLYESYGFVKSEDYYYYSYEM